MICIGSQLTCASPNINIALGLQIFILHSGVQTGTEGRPEGKSHVVDLQLSLGLVLFLEVSRQLVEDGAAAAPLRVQTRRAADLVDLQARFLVCKQGNKLRICGTQTWI